MEMRERPEENWESSLSNDTCKISAGEASIEEPSAHDLRNAYRGGSNDAQRCKRN